MTYRIGAHSTSDDDSKYRTKESPLAGWTSERAYWESRAPTIRFGRYMQSKGWYSVALEEKLRKQARKEAIDALNKAERASKPSYEHLFTDVLDVPPWMLRDQQEALRDHLLRHQEYYSNFVVMDK